jgi:hypothetical protein
MFAWFGMLWNSMPPDDLTAHSASVWLQSGMQASLLPVATTTNSFASLLRAQFEPIRARNRGERSHPKPPLWAIWQVKSVSLFLPLLARAAAHCPESTNQDQASVWSNN